MLNVALPSPIGPLGLSLDDDVVCEVRFGADEWPAVEELSAQHRAQLAAPIAQIESYFVGELTEFDLPLAAGAGSSFERAVWAQISAIPYGETRTYGEIAAAVGNGDWSAARSVGVACNRNPLPVLVPCHRVVGAGGKLVGFGGGLPRKRFLLALEARVRVERDFAPG